MGLGFNVKLGKGTVTKPKFQPLNTFVFFFPSPNSLDKQLESLLGRDEFSCGLAKRKIVAVVGNAFYFLYQ